jgi:hypothetical protein
MRFLHQSRGFLILIGIGRFSDKIRLIGRICEGIVIALHDGFHLNEVLRLGSNDFSSGNGIILLVSHLSSQILRS